MRTLSRGDLEGRAVEGARVAGGLVEAGVDVMAVIASEDVQTDRVDGLKNEKFGGWLRVLPFY